MLDSLLHRHRIWRGAGPLSPLPAIPSGYPALDAELPGGGWPAGGLTEILAGRRGIGELELLLPSLAALTWAGRRVAWLAPPHLPYAPALAAAGVDLAHLVVISAPGRRDSLWAAEQVLRAGSCHALLAWLERASYDELRRLAIAAEAGGTWLALFRPPQSARESSPASLRLLLDPDGDALGVRILKRRGPPPAGALSLQVKRPFHALGRCSLLPSPSGVAAADRGLGLPVHS
jgi:hypothetical protein